MRRVGRSKLLWSIAALLLLYTLGGFLLAPYLVEHYLPSLAEQHLGRRAAIEKVRINPYALTFEASGFRLDDKGEKALLAFKRFFIDFEVSSLFRRAWTFAEVRLESADLGLEIDRDARLNLLDVLDRLLKSREPDEPATRVIVAHLVIQDSRVSLTDLSGATRGDAAFTPIDLELRNLSTIADSEGRYTLDARLPAGGTLAWKGSVSLEPLASAGELSIERMKLQNAWQFRRTELRPTTLQGDLSIAGRYDFRYKEGQTALVLDGVQVELSRITLALQGEKEPLLALGTIRMSDATFALSDREIVVQKLAFADGALNLIVSETGLLNWGRMTAPTEASGSAAEAPADSSAERPWRIRFPTATIDKVALTYADRGASPALAVTSAALNAGLSLDVAAGAGPTQVVLGDIALTLEKTVIATPAADTRFASLDALTVAGGVFDLQQRTVRATRVELKRGDVALAVGSAGPEGLIKALSTPSPVESAAPKTASDATGPRAGVPESSTTEPARPWRIQIEKAGIEKLAIQYDHKSGPSAAKVRVDELNSAFSLDMTAGAGAARTIAGDLQLAMERVKLHSVGTEAPVATLDSLKVSGGRIDTGERSAAVKTIALTGAGFRIVRGPDGALEPFDAFASNRADTAPAARAHAADKAGAWRYRVDAVALNRLSAALSDRSYTPTIAYDVEVASATAKNIDSGSKKPIAFTAALRVGKEGTASGEGTLQQDFAGATAQLTLARLPITPLHPVLAKHATLDLKSGHLSAKARVTYQSTRKPMLVARGELGIDDVLINESGTNERFASWKALAAEGIAFNLSPDSLAIRQLRVVEPGAKIVIARDRTINITKVIRKEATPAGVPANAPAPSVAAAADTPPAFPYDIGTIRLDNGMLDFADLSLVLPFATQVHALNGAIVGISSDAQARAELKLAGQVDKYGEARADGVLIPRDPEKFLDITARFNNVDMASLSPYSATFAGRKIDEGKLSLVLEYKIVNAELAGENRIVLRDFKLGERIEAPGAMNLPLDLAIALLKDSDGRITLEVPVRGNVGNPEFEYGKVIRAAIGNVIARIITAPFRALGALFGKRDSEAARTVSFAPGSDALAPSQREQLDAVAKALKARPQLRIIVKGPYDAAQDSRQLQRSQARLALARALRANLQPGEDPGPIAYGRADTQRALEALLAQRAGSDALAQLEKTFAGRTGRQPDRVNPVLGLVGRGSKDTEFYEAVFDRVSEAEPLPDTAVRGLAESRANVIIDTLAKAGLDRARLTSGGVTQVKTNSDSAVQTELALEAMPAGL